MKNDAFVKRYMDNSLELIQHYLDDSEMESFFDEEDCCILSDRIERMEIALPREFYQTIRKIVDRILDVIYEPENNSFDWDKDMEEMQGLIVEIQDDVFINYVTDNDEVEPELNGGKNFVNLSEMDKQIVYDIYLHIWDFIYEDKYTENREFDRLSDKLTRYYLGLSSLVLEPFFTFIENDLEPFAFINEENNEEIIELMHKKIATLDNNIPNFSDYEKLGSALEIEFQNCMMEKIHPFLIN